MAIQPSGFDKTKEVYKNLDPRVRLGVQVVGFGLAVYIIYRLIKKQKQMVVDKPFSTEAQATANDLEELNKNPYTRQKISNSQASAFANKIYSCMKGLGTYEYEMIGVFYHLKNDADFLAVEKAFGIRTIPSGTFLVGDFRGNMTSCIADELSVDYIKKINTILSKKGIRRRV
jgi:dethiobiotin synthetase